MIWENLRKIEFPANIEYVEADEKRIALTAMMTGMDKTDEADVNKISAYLYFAGQEILQRCYPFNVTSSTTVPERYAALQCEIAAYMLNKQGADGEISHSENGVTRTYESGGVPESFLKQITPMGVVY